MALPRATPVPTIVTHTRDVRASGMGAGNPHGCLHHTKYKLLEDGFHGVTSQVMKIVDCNHWIAFESILLRC